MAAIVFAAVIPGAGAQACDVFSYAASRSPRPVERDNARAMVDRAYRVVVAVAESNDPIDVEAYVNARLPIADPVKRHDLAEHLARDAQGHVGRITFRVIDTLKGPPQDEVSLLGYFSQRTGTEARRREAMARRGDLSRPEDVWWRQVLEYDHDSGVRCEGTVFAQEGATYLIFLDFEGGLLDGGLQFRDRSTGAFTRMRGPSYEEVSGEDDPWLARVRRAAARR